VKRISLSQGGEEDKRTTKSATDQVKGKRGTVEGGTERENRGGEKSGWVSRAKESELTQIASGRGGGCRLKDLEFPYWLSA